jgi:hypothetical protein
MNTTWSISHNKKLIIYMKKVIVFLLLSFIKVNIHFAQDFEVSPVMINFKVEPGNNEVRKIAITNHSDKTQSFSLKFSDYEFDQTGKQQKLKAGDSGRSILNFITVTPTFFELLPNQRTFVDLTLTVPLGEYGTKWGIISVEATQEKTSIEVDKSLATGILVSPRISIYVYQSPKSNTNYKAKILSFNEKTNINDQNVRLFNLKVHNIGDKEINGEVTLILSNLATGEEKKIYVQKHKMYPNVIKDIEMIVKDIKPGKYALAAIFDYGKDADLEGAQLIIEQK